MKNKSSAQKSFMGFLVLLLATVAFSFTGLFARVAAEEMGPFTQTVLRAAIMSLLFFIGGMVTKTFRPVERKDVLLVIFRGAFVVIDFACFTYAVTQLPLGTTLFLFYAAFIGLNFIYGALVFREKIDKVKTAGVLLALIGLYTLYRDGFSSLSFFPALAAMTSGTFFGLITATSKNLSDTYSPSQINLITFGSAAIIALAVLLVSPEGLRIDYSAASWIAITFFAVVLAIANYAIIVGFNYLEAQRASLVLLAEVIFTVFVGWFFYSEIPTVNTLLGGICITIALALPNLSFLRLLKPKR